MERTAVFEELRGYLFALAYRMLGSGSDAEDVLQETYLRWRKTPAQVESPKAFLSKVTTRLCIDHLRSAKVRREAYVGPWLPEPIATEEALGPEEVAEQADSLSIAFLVVLESLSPTERAVFLLREVFEYDYSEIAEIVDLTETNCRQVAHRAKQHIASRRPRCTASAERRDELTYRFLEACALGDMDGLMAVLTRDITLHSDGGGRVRAARRPILGRDKVARYLIGIVKQEPEGHSSGVVYVNGQPALALYRDGRLRTVLALDHVEEGIRGVHVVFNPDKLTRVHQ